MGISTTGISTSWPVLDEALGLLRDAAGSVADEHRADRTPCALWNVGQLIFHAGYDQFAWATAVDGGPSAGVDPFDPPVLLEGPLIDLVDSAIRRAAGAWSTVAPGTLAVPTPLPVGPMTAEAAVRACAMDAAVHAWDVSVALGRPSGLTDELAAEFLPVARGFVEPLRQWGAFGPELAGDPAEGATAALLRYLGRDPLGTA